VRGAVEGEQLDRVGNWKLLAEGEGCPRRREKRTRLLRFWLAPWGTWGSLNQGQGYAPLVAPLLAN